MRHIAIFSNLTIFALLLLAFTLFPEQALAQIELQNPSFEGLKAEATVPNGWDACGRYSTPDILPGFWEVNDAPNHGGSYIGLITREDNTWEFIGQRLSEPMKKAECYEFSIALANSGAYSGYSLPLRFRIWGGNTVCGKHQLLAETEVIKHHNWKEYSFFFFPKRSINYIVLEAYYAEDAPFPYRGNLLLDNCSSIDVCIRADLLDEIPVQTDNCNEG